MIERFEYSLDENQPVAAIGGVTLTALGGPGTGPATVSLSAEGTRLELPAFAEMRFVSSKQKLLPHCELVRWRDLYVVLGIPSLVIVGRNGPSPCALFRRASDDTGFYNVDWREGGDTLFCVYEGGILAISARGEVRWHQPKAWDDLLVGLDDEALYLSGHAGKTLRLDAATGLPRGEPWVV